MGQQITIMSLHLIKQTAAELVQTRPASMRAGALAVAGALVLLVSWVLSPVIGSLEEQVGALGWTLSSETEPEQRITLVVIDEASIAEIGPWPWSRSNMASLVRAIDDAGAQLQIHDISYPENRPGDAEFESALAVATGAVIAQVPALGAQRDAPQAGALTHSLAGVSCDAGAGGLNLWSASGYVGSASVFEGIPKGHNAAIIETDGSVRRSPAVVCVEGQAYPALSIAAFLQLGSTGQWRGVISPGSGILGPEYVMTLEGYPGLDIPLDSRGAMRVSFARSPESFRAVSAADVMAGRVEPDLLRNAWVLVGGTAFGMADIVPTPYSGAAYGVELQARLLTSLLDVEIPYTPASAGLFLLLACLIFGALLYALVSRSERLAVVGLPVAALLLPLVAALSHGYVLATTNLWLGWLLPALFGSFGALALLLLEMARVRLERSRVFNNLNSYLPDSIARDIAFSLPSSSIEAQRVNVTLLNADLRNFSRFGETRPPEEAAAMLHYFFTRATEVVEAHGGELQEFRGDGILALWQAADSRTAEQALAAASDLTAALDRSLLPSPSLKGLEPLALGVSIEQGPVLLGSIGPAHRRTHTVLGDTVSITLRIQEMTAELAQPVLVGECAARQLGNTGLISQGSYLLSGLQTPHTLFAPAPSASVISLPAAAPPLSVVKDGR